LGKRSEANPGKLRQAGNNLEAIEKRRNSSFPVLGIEVAEEALEKAITEASNAQFTMDTTTGDAMKALNKASKIVEGQERKRGI
jgi:hypothetical protein